MTRRPVSCLVLASLVLALSCPAPVAAEGVLRSSPPSSSGGVVLLYAPDGKSLISAHGREGFSLCGGTTGAPQLEFRTDQGTVAAVALSADGKTLAVACSRGGIQLWELPVGKALPTLK